MQLNLFEWDLLAVGAGYQALAELNFPEAERRFLSVLGSMPDHPQAGAGLKDTRFWRECYLEAMSLPAESAAILLWRELQHISLPARRHHTTLRQRLLRHVHDLLSDRPGFFHPPDLCLGHLLLLLGNHHAAETNLRSLAEMQPGCARLHLLHAETLLRQNRRELAAAAYARALLLDPEDIGRQHIGNRQLAACIEEHGPLLTPIYAFFRGVLPLVEHPQTSDAKGARCYPLLRSIELARRNGDHRALIDGRRALKDMAPEIFQDYLSWLEEKENGS